jgi:hypothetical protein
LLFGAVARYTAACASASSPSGLPSRSYVSAAATVICSAPGAALPISSEANRIILRAT